MLEIRNAVATPPASFFFFHAVSAAASDGFQVMLAVGGHESGNRETDITYSAMPRFFAVSSRNDWRFRMGEFPAFGLASIVCGSQSTGWRIDGMIDRTAIWRAWKGQDSPGLAQQLGIPVAKADMLPRFGTFDEFAEKVVVPLMPRRRQIIQKAWQALAAMPSDHWPGEYRDGNRWRQVNFYGKPCYHNWKEYPEWDEKGGISWKRSRHLISSEGKFLCGPTVRTLNREVMRVVEALEAGSFAG